MKHFDYESPRGRQSCGVRMPAAANRLFAILLLLSLSLQVGGCNAKSNDTGALVIDTSENIDLPVTVAQFQYYSLVDLKNAGGEENPGQAGSPIVNPETFGWDSNGPCFYMDDYIAAGNGSWRMNMAKGCSIYQMTDHSIAVNEAYSVIFNASSFAGAPTTVVVELYVDDENKSTVASQKVEFVQPVFNEWRSYQMLVPYGALNDYEGQLIGVRFVNPATTAQYLSVDNILFEAHKPDDKKTASFNDNWGDSCKQYWAGENYWANRMNDWQVSDGRLQTRAVNESMLRRTVHRISSVVSSRPADFKLSVASGSLDGSNSKGSYSGFLIGTGFRLDHRAAALIHNRHGKNGGLIAGVNHEGRAFIRDNDVSPGVLTIADADQGDVVDEYLLELQLQLREDQQYELTLNVADATGVFLNKASIRVPAWRVMGNIALVSNPGEAPATKHWFNDFRGSGEKLINASDRRFGPVMFTSYTLSRQMLTVNAQFPPVCSGQYQNIRLESKQGNSWKKIASADLDPDSHTAQFRVFAWDEDVEVDVRVAVDEVKNGERKPHYYYAKVQPDPVGKSEIVVAGLTCRPGVILSSEGWIQQFSSKPFSWTEKRIAFPHQELLINAEKHNADLIVFTGDQIYEFDPNGWVDKSSTDNLINDYLYKWYLFGWSVRDYIRNKPSIIIPDDHDVFQANFWGEGGRAADNEAAGGYVFPARFIEVVQKTQTGSLPPAYDPTPVEQGIGVYYTDVVYGGVGFAILEDRKFKSGPASPDLPRKLLGERQHLFLTDWAKNWEGQEMKLVVSQAPFAMSHTHSGSNLSKSTIDQDSNGWPKPQRDEAVSLIRAALAPHLNGDQHLGLTLKHGVDNPRDAFYSFSVPSMLNIFPRIWDPQNAEDGPGDRSNNPAGSYIDQHGNFIDVLAAANPNSYFEPIDVDTENSKYDLGTGYGVVSINKPERSYTMTAWPINQDPSDPEAEPYSGWPIQFYQHENDGREVKGFLPEIVVEKSNPVVQLFSDASGELIYARRLQSPAFTAHVYDLNTTYTVKMLWPEIDEEKVYVNLKAIATQ